MPLHRFRIDAPTEVAEAVALLDEHGDDASVYAGGTELLLALKAGFLAVDRLVDVKGIAELGEVREGQDEVVIGAAVTYRTLERHPAVRRRIPALARLVSEIANVRVRTAGTLAGNLCFAEPHSDPAVLLMCMDAEVACRGPGGERRIPMAGFFAGPYESAIHRDEVATRVHVPTQSARSPTAFERFRTFERPTANAAVRLDLDGEDRVARAVVAVGAAGPTPARASPAEAVLVGAARGDLRDRVPAVRDAVSDEIEVMEDGYGSEDFKRHLSAELVVRALARVTGDPERSDG